MTYMTSYPNMKKEKKCWSWWDDSVRKKEYLPPNLMTKGQSLELTQWKKKELILLSWTLTSSHVLWHALTPRYCL